MERIVETTEVLIVEGVCLAVRIACWNPIVAHLLDQPVI